MAIISKSSPLQNISGTLGGDIIFKDYGNKTVVSMKPRRRRKNSERQQLSLNKFKEAAKYARTLLRDPAKREQYKTRARKLNKHSAYNLIISEYMLSIRIQTKETAPAKTDKKHITLTVTKKNFKVESASVQLLSPGGETITIGSANRIGASDWTFKLPEPPQKGSMLIVTAIDALSLPTTKYLYL